MKRLRRFISLCLVAVMMLSLSVTTFATELAGDDVFPCEVTILVTDLTGGYAGESFKVTFKDVTGTVNESIEITKAGSWGAGQAVKLSLPAPTTYNITFEGIAEGYEIIDTFTNSPAVTTFAASEGIKDFNWSIALKGQEQTEPTGESIKNEVVSTDRDNITVENQEAEDAYREFLEAVSFIQTDASWSEGFAAALNQFEKGSANGDLYCSWYVEYVEGGTEEEFFAMTPFERFLWTNTYTRLAYAVKGSNSFYKYFETREAFRYNVLKSPINTMSGNNCEAVIAAYEKLMDWQYDYIMENFEPFNFILNRSYTEVNGTSPEGTQEATDVIEPDGTETPTEGTSEPYHGDDVGSDSGETAPVETKSEEGDEEKGIWSDTLSILAKNSITVIILALLALAVVIVVQIRKSRDFEG